MTQKEIISMAREAGLPTLTEYGYESLQRFAELVLKQRTKELMQLFLDPENQPTQFGTATLEYREAEVLAEREECAKACEQGTGEAVQTATLEILLRERKRIAKAIRTRGEK